MNQLYEAKMHPDPDYTGPELNRMEAHAVVDLLKQGEVSPSEALAATFTRLEQVEPAINAMPTTCRERAEKALASLDDALKDHPGYLAGLPLGIKDLERVKGVRTTFGTKSKADYVPDYSDHFVENLEQRGGVIVGKTNTPEMGAGGNTFNEVFGATRNPWDTNLNAAGSSGGAAASLATGETWLSQGSDNAGSLRTPAAFCGVVGLRPSPGRVAVTVPKGANAAFICEGVYGPMARSVRDCALFLDAMGGFEPRQPISYPAPEIPFQQSVLQADGKVRIAFAPDLNGLGPVEKEIDDQMRLALGKVEAGGGTVVEDCPDLADLEKTYLALRGFGMLTGFLREPESTTRHFKATLKENIKFAQSLTLEDLANANLDRARLFTNVQNFLTDFDVLACPTVGCLPRPVEQEWVSEINGIKMNGYLEWLQFSFLSTATLLPAISVPIGIGPSGMPIGMQLIGQSRGEAKLLAVARAVEVAVGGPLGPIDPNITHI